MLAIGHRYRCDACGNLTRFDQEAKRHTKRFLHFALSGECQIEDEEIISEELVAVVCRWCGASDRIEQVPVLEPD